MPNENNSKTSFFSQINFAIENVLSKLKSSLLHSLQAKDYEKFFAFRLDGDNIDKTGIEINFDSDLIKEVFEGKEELLEIFKSKKRIHDLDDQARKDLAVDICELLKSKTEHLKSKYSEKNIPRKVYQDRKEQYKGKVNDFLKSQKCDLTENEKIKFEKFFDRLLKIKNPQLKKIRQEHPHQAADLIKYLKEQNLYDKMITEKDYEELTLICGSNETLLKNLKLCILNHNKRLGTEDNFQDNKKNKIHHKQAAMVESIFKIPLHNKVSLDKEHRTKILQTFLNKIYPDHEILMNFWHGNENTLLSKDYGDHCHIFMSGIDSKTGLTNITKRNFEISEEYAIENDLPKPSDIEDEILQWKMIGRYRQELWFKHINEYSIEHNLNLKFEMLPDTEEKAAMQKKYAIESSKRKKDRLYNHYNYREKEYLEMEHTLTANQKDEYIINNLMKPKLNVLLDKMQTLYISYEGVNFDKKVVELKNEIEMFLKDSKNDLNDKNHLLYREVKEVIKLRFRSYSEVRKTRAAKKLEALKLEEKINTLTDELNKKNIQNSLLSNVEQQLKEAQEKHKEILESITKLNLKRDIEKINAQSALLTDSQKEQYMQEVADRMHQEFEKKTEIIENKNKENIDDIVMNFLSFQAMYSDLSVAVMGNDKEQAKSFLKENKEAINDTINAYKRKIESLSVKDNILHKSVLEGFIGVVIMAENLTGESVLQNEQRKVVKVIKR